MKKYHFLILSAIVSLICFNVFLSNQENKLNNCLSLDDIEANGDFIDVAESVLSYAAQKFINSFKDSGTLYHTCSDVYGEEHIVNGKRCLILYQDYLCIYGGLSQTCVLGHKIRSELTRIYR